MLRVLVVAVCLLAAVRGQQLTVEVSGPSSAFVQQPVEFVVTVAYDEQWFAEHGVQLSRRRLAVPLHLDVPWLVQSDERAVEWVEGDGVALAVGDRTVPAERLDDQVRDGRTFKRLALRARWLPLAAGRSRLDPIRARYRYADAFEDDLLRGRQPVDPQDAVVESQPLELVVSDLPKPTPPGFTGAVGEFELHMSSSVTSTSVGDTFEVQVSVRGPGNLFEFATLRPPVLPGFHVQGVVWRRSPGAGARTFVLDVLALRRGVRELPPVTFVAFSPKEGDYVTLTGPRLPMSVGPVRKGRKLSKRVRELIAADAERSSPWWWLVYAIGGVLFVRGVMRARGAQRASGEAARRLRELQQMPWQDAAAVLAVFEAVVGPGGSGDVVGIRERLEAARFGGPMPERAEVVAVVERLR